MKRALVIFILIFLLSLAHLAQAVQWEVIETEHFRIHYPPDQPGAAKTLAESAENVLKTTTGAIRYDFQGKITVFLAPDRQTYQSIQPRAMIPEWSVGVAFDQEKLIIIYTPRGAAGQGYSYDMIQVFHHELCHIVLGNALKDVHIPRWLNEGFAKFHAHEWSLNDSYHLTLAYMLGSTMPLDELMYKWPKNASKARIAYLQSKTFVAYLERRNDLPAIIQNMRQGMPADKAVLLATGYPLDVLEKRWERYYTRAHTWLFILFRREFIWTSMALLFLFVYWRVRRRTKLKLKKMEIEDKMEDRIDSGPTYH